MPAIISDQFRILNAETFIQSFTSIGNTSNNYYAFLGQPNSGNSQAGGSPNWGEGLNPLDSFTDENQIKQTIISLKKITNSDVRRVIRKVEWSAGTTYEMYRHDYSVYNKTPVTNSTRLYESNYYVINEDLRVYICLQNGSNPDNPKGKPSFDQPTFTDLEPRVAGTSGDGYIWKYLFTIKPSEIIKFDSIDFIPVPEGWGTTGESISIKNNAIDGKIQIITITNSGSGYQYSGGLPYSFTNIPILGDGTGGTATVIVNSIGKVTDVFVTEGGSGYTTGIINFIPGASGVPEGLTNTGGTASFDVIIPPKGGHGYDIYRELGTYRVLLYSRFQTDLTNPDTILGNDFARVGVIKNPTVFGSDVQLLTASEVSALKALKLIGTAATSTTYPVDSIITQTIGTGITAIGFVASWDKVTGVLKYYQPVGLATALVNYKINDFSASISGSGSLSINCTSPNFVGGILQIDTGFNGPTTTINNTQYQLGQSFNSGISSVEYNKKSGEIIYIDNRSAIPLSSSQKEDIKIVLEF
jgi:hypothetical protein